MTAICTGTFLVPAVLVVDDETGKVLSVEVSEVWRRKARVEFLGKLEAGADARLYLTEED